MEEADDAGPAGRPGRIALTEAKYAGEAFVLASVLTFQVGAVIAVHLFDRVGPLSTSMLRLSFGALLSWLIWRPRVHARRAGELRLVVAFGLALGGTNVLLYQALDRLPLGVAVTVLIVGPLMLTVVRRRDGSDLVWVAAALAGIVLIVHPVGGGLNALGLVFAAGSAVCAATYISLGARVADRFPGGQGLAIGLAVAGLLVLGPGIVAARAPLLDPAVLGLGAAMAVLTAVIPHSCELAALRRMPTRVFGVLTSLEPAVAALFGLIFLHQALPTAAILGIVCVVVAAVGIGRGPREDLPGVASP